MKNFKQNVVVEHDFHPETVEEIRMLRDVRLALAKKQLANLDETLDQMIRRNLISSQDRQATKKELETELRARLIMLESRDHEGDVHADEISLYVDLV